MPPTSRHDRAGAWLALAATALAACYDPELPGGGDGPGAADAPAGDGATGDGVGCPSLPDCEAVLLGSRCVAICEQLLPHSTASTYCEDRNACLATLNAEESAVLATRGEYLWFGLAQLVPETSPSEGWVWSCDGSPVTETHWDLGEPDDDDGTQNCAELTPTLGVWWDKACTEPDWFVCQAR